MKTKSLMIAIALMALVMGMGTAANATPITVSIVPSIDAAGTIPLTQNQIPPGGRFFINIRVDNAANISGVALTLNYPTAYFEVIKNIASVNGVAQPGQTPTETEVTGLQGATLGILESDAFSDFIDGRCPTGTTGCTAPTTPLEILRVAKLDAANGKVVFSGAAINPDTNTGGNGPYTGPKNIFRIRFRALSTAALGSTGQFYLSLNTPTLGGWNGTDTVWPLIGSAAKGTASFDSLTSPVPNNSVSDCATYAFCNLDYTIANSVTTPLTITVQGAPGNIKGGTTPPILPDVTSLLYYYKHLKNTPGYETYTADKYFGNLDFDHNGVVNLLDVQQFLYYYKHLKNTPGYEAYTTVE